MWLWRKKEKRGRSGNCIGEQCIRNDDSVLTVSDEINDSLKSLSREFFEHRVLMGQEEFFSRIYSQRRTSLNKQRYVRDSISKMKNGKTIGSLRVLSEMVKATGEGGVDMITDVVNQIVVGLIPQNENLALLYTTLREKEILQKRRLQGAKVN